MLSWRWKGEVLAQDDRREKTRFEKEWGTMRPITDIVIYSASGFTRTFRDYQMGSGFDVNYRRRIDLWNYNRIRDVLPGRT